jgi:hypothetical protein
MTQSKVDFKRELREFYAPGVEPVMVDVPELAFLMIDGRGDPNTAPEFSEVFREAQATALEKKPLEALRAVRLERFAEGRAGQVLHIGPYAAEGPTIERLHAFIAEQGYALAGKHHEIYLGDPRRVAPEKLKTVIRRPIAARSA